MIFSLVHEAFHTATNIATAQVLNATTSDNGFYVLNALPVGAYTVEVEKTGFKKFVRQGLELSTAATIPLDVQLEIGDITEAVAVTGETPLLQARTSDINQTIESRSVQELPLGDRRTLNLLQLTGATTFVTYEAGEKPTFSIAGGRTQTQTFIGHN